MHCARTTRTLPHPSYPYISLFQGRLGCLPEHPCPCSTTPLAPHSSVGSKQELQHTSATYPYDSVGEYVSCTSKCQFYCLAAVGMHGKNDKLHNCCLYVQLEHLGQGNEYIYPWYKLWFVMIIHLLRSTDPCLHLSKIGYLLACSAKSLPKSIFLQLEIWH